MDIIELISELKKLPICGDKIVVACDKGWYSLVLECCQRLQQEADRYPDCMTRVSDIKEKYGELRVYLSTETDRMSDIIEEYTKRSLETCEMCANPGRMTKIDGWYSPLCERCALECDERTFLSAGKQNHSAEMVVKFKE